MIRIRDDFANDGGSDKAGATRHEIAKLHRKYLILLDNLVLYERRARRKHRGVPLAAKSSRRTEQIQAKNLLRDIRRSQQTMRGIRARCDDHIL